MATREPSGDPVSASWGTLPDDVADPNQGRVCCLCGAPIRAGMRYAHYAHHCNGVERKDD